MSSSSSSSRFISTSSYGPERHISRGQIDRHRQLHRVPPPPPPPRSRPPREMHKQRHTVVKRNSGTQSHSSYRPQRAVKKGFVYCPAYCEECEYKTLEAQFDPLVRCCQHPDCEWFNQHPGKIGKNRRYQTSNVCRVCFKKAAAKNKICQTKDCMKLTIEEQPNSLCWNCFATRADTEDFVEISEGLTLKKRKKTSWRDWDRHHGCFDCEEDHVKVEHEMKDEEPSGAKGIQILSLRLHLPLYMKLVKHNETSVILCRNCLLKRWLVKLSAESGICKPTL